MNLKAFSGRDLQNTRAIIAICSAEGITSLRLVVEILEREELSKRAKRRVATDKEIRKERLTGTKLKECPSCENMPLLPVVDGKNRPVSIDGMAVIGCRKCRYSEVVA